MEIKSSSGIVTITGNIKTIADFQSIKQTVDGVVATHKLVTINIVDSLSITSSVIGYLNKLVLKDKVDVRLIVGNEELFNLLDDLNLVSTFKAYRSML
ncbi:MAG: hypothetical protein PHX44_03175 [Sulfurimonas sp.]|uniref:hypothetical protein n=1 Tax=Sulfurimonas sp. TaxID=2022749 RepID=UPI00261D235C|nr:hypothetical protein [Sulfurimonas sp.]MDD2652035.1 hypothetical protein [Sulfurimonas sp.]MDD3452056.1 hypothetical protein [Sulfurimonas sp.]